jgi:hypothetical protein
MFYVDHSIIDSLRTSLKDSMSMPFVTFPHTAWSLEKAMEKIVETNLATLNPSEKKIRVDMEQRLRDLIDQEYLVQTGYKQGLHQSAAVRNDLKVWRDSYLSQFVRNRSEDTVSVSQNDIEELRRVMRNDTSIINNTSRRTRADAADQTF